MSYNPDKPHIDMRGMPVMPNIHRLRSMDETAAAYQSGHDMGVRGALKLIERHAPERADLVVMMRAMSGEGGYLG